jgi:hypothetical protein
MSQCWGDLRIDPNQELPEEWSPSASFRPVMLCRCGRTSNPRFADLPNTITCGSCDFKSKTYWLEQSWGKLCLDPNQELPEEWGIGYTSKLQFICSCNRHLKTKFKTVREGKATSCNHCNDRVRSYWLEQSWGLLQLAPSQELPEEWSYGSTRSYEFFCTCGNVITKPFRYATLGGLQSCGCSQIGRGPRSVEVQIFNWARERFPDSQRAARTPLQTLELDVWIPSLQVGIEYHGLYWHSEGAIRKPLADSIKYQRCLEKGIRLIQIYSDEPWEEILTRELLSPFEPQQGWIDNRFCNWRMQLHHNYTCILEESPHYSWTDGITRCSAEVSPDTPRKWFRIWDSGRSFWQKHPQPMGQ